MQPKDIKIRCSSLGYIMTNPRSKSEILSETCKVHLCDIMVSAKYGRQTDIKSKYITKGLMVEEDSITLYSRVTKTFFKKNEEWLQNDFITGTPDIYIGESIHKAEKVIDIKSSWDIFTFFRNHEAKLNQNYYWQLQGYMWLTGAKSATLAYCLVDTPDTLIYDEERKLMYQMGAATIETSEYVEACKELRKNLTYEDIPLEERLISIDIERDEEAINSIMVRVLECRKYMASTYKSLFDTPVLLAHHDSEVDATIIQQG